jgi:hypothetical protein
LQYGGRELLLCQSRVVAVEGGVARRGNVRHAITAAAAAAASHTHQCALCHVAASSRVV